MSGMEKGHRRLRVAYRLVANRPRLCKNAKRNLLSKHWPSKTRCIRLFLVGYWSEDPRIRNSVEFLHSLGRKAPSRAFTVSSVGSDVGTESQQESIFLSHNFR